tara:strand:+ start:91 stop:288 length:198 start_codon:yes stop_codon:yes gene_type:complete
MDSNEIAVLCAGISSVLAVLIYFTKNIKESSCLGSKCVQDTTHNIETLNPMDEALQTFPIHISNV